MRDAAHARNPQLLPSPKDMASCQIIGPEDRLYTHVVLGSQLAQRLAFRKYVIIDKHRLSSDLRGWRKPERLLVIAGLLRANDLPLNLQIASQLFVRQPKRA